MGLILVKFWQFVSKLVLSRVYSNNIKMTQVLWPEAHFICPWPTLSKWVTVKSCRSRLPPQQSFPNSQLCNSPFTNLNLFWMVALHPLHSKCSSHDCSPQCAQCLPLQGGSCCCCCCCKQRWQLLVSARTPIINLPPNRPFLRLHQKIKNNMVDLGVVHVVGLVVGHDSWGGHEMFYICH